MSDAKPKFRKIRGVRILHEDMDVIVVEKSAGVLSCATRRGGEHTVEDALNDYVRKGQVKSRKQVYLVHRLDRETSGVMMVAKTPDVQEYFRSNWNELTEKTYLARVRGTLASKEGVFESYLAEDRKTLLVRSVKNPKYGKLARTLYRVLAEDGNTSLVEVRLKSGRKNQIRVHFSENGHPIVGDSRYGRDKGGLMLHSWKLEFKHPFTGRKMSFQTNVPAFASEINEIEPGDPAK
ncbi:MAG: RNA pseudouridine synthase [Kiritimatiellae bacterium]|nr:RNA pseudouridine synthase [Kiritimatiellia bacterium]